MNVKEMLEKQQSILNTAKAEGRELTPAEDTEFKSLTNQIDALLKNQNDDNKDAVIKERQRVSDVIALCKNFNVDPTDYIEKQKDGKALSADEVKTIILEKLYNEFKPIAQKSTDLNVIQSEDDKFRQAVTDAIVFTGIQKGEANSFAGKGLKAIAAECLIRDGEKADNVRNMSPDELMGVLERTFLNPTASFPSIVDSAVKKTIVELYKAKPTTFQEWVTEGSVNDFKPTPDHEYVMGSGDFEEVPEGGELKQSILETQLLPKRTIKTYGRQFTITREAFYNDDIGFIAKMPQKYTIGALRKIDMQVYQVLMDNPVIFDSKNLFHADHENLINSGSVPSEDSLNDIEVLMSNQKDQFKNPIFVYTDTIIIPAEYKMSLYKVLHSTQTPGTNNNDANMFYGEKYKVIVTPYIKHFAKNNAKPWFAVANKDVAKSIQVDYLRGQKTPTFVRKEAAGRLGLIWDIFMDWGISVVDFRGIYKNPGTV